MYSTGKDLIFCNDIYKLRQPRKFWTTYTWNISAIRKQKMSNHFLISRGEIMCKTICRNFNKLQNKIAYYFSTHPMLEEFELVPRFLPTYFTVAIIITYILAKNLNFYTAIKNCKHTWRLPNSYSSDFLEFEFRKWPYHEKITK